VDERVRVLGRVTTYRDEGDGRPLLFLHGWGLAHHAYRATLDALARPGIRVLAPTLPGFGGTKALAGEFESIEGYAAWVAAFLAEVGIEDPAVVVGHSFGGAVAVQLAHDHPSYVRGLVLVNSVGGSAWKRHGSAIRSMAERPIWDWGLHLQRDLRPSRQMTRVVPVVLGAAIPNLLRDPRAFWRAARIARTVDLTAELEELKRRRLPVVVLWGRDDTLVPEATVDAMCEALGSPERITVEGGHAWLIAEPEAFAEVITNVLPVASRPARLVRDGRSHAV
jgi:pimeloyl-ACP methyl ester carboxylesterase